MKTPALCPLELELEEIIKKRMKKVISLINVCLVGYVLLIKSYESLFLSSIFLILVMSNFLLTISKIKKELNNDKKMTLLIVFILVTLIIYFMKYFFDNASLKMTKLSLIIYGISLVILYIYYSYRTLKK